ncbi:MAG: energy transducer TonB, partial [Burkholderiales bacterium]|nr:energy transducer TonB [Burkholderiales bacterium]
TPLFRPKAIEPPPTITVELMPPVEPAAKVAPAPPSPEVIPESKPEPIVELPPEPVAEVVPEPIPKPELKPKPEPKPKPGRKKPAPVKAPPPETAPEPEVASEPTPPPIAKPSAPEAPPPVVIPSEPLKPQAQPVDDNLLDGYAQILSGAIGKFQKYPRVAQMRGWEGTVEVLLKIAAGGAVRDISLVKSSGFDVLDEQALAMVKQATPLPKPPANLSARDFSVKVPIVFRLKK